MTVSEVAAYLRAHDKYLILTHRRPDGDTLGCAAALCAMLRQMGKTAGILYNRETTEHFEQYVEQYWVADDFDYETVVSVDLAALSLFPDNAEMFKNGVKSLSCGVALSTLLLMAMNRTPFFGKRISV